MCNYMLSEVVEIIGGGTPKTSVADYWNGDIPWLSVKDFGNDLRYVYDSEKKITELGLRNSTTVLLQKDDIIISARGTVGELAMIPYPMAFNQSCYGIRAKEGKINSAYLFYFLKNSIQILKQNTHGSVFDTITRATFGSLPIHLPDMEHQKIVVSILSALDDKIELNQRINENLERQIFALFQSKYQVPASGENWVDGCIGDVITLQRGHDLPKNRIVNGPYPVAGSTDTIAFHSDFTTEPPCIVMGRSGNIGKPRLYLQRCWAHNTTLFSKEFKDSNPYWVYAMLRNIDYRQFQGGSAVPTLNRNYVHAFPIKIPPKVKQNEFGRFASTLFKAIADNIDESNTLALLRDTLLPKLISGEIDVSDVQL